MQLRYATELTSSEYVTRQAWREARLERCPLHPEGGCGFARHGSYPRVHPPGTRIARCYCPKGQQTFSLLPDCLAARYSGTLEEFEAAVRDRDGAPSLEAAVADYRLEIGLVGVLRWLRRRRQAVAITLGLIRGLMPLLCPGCKPTLGAFQRCLGVEWVLRSLRAEAGEHLQRLPPPLGFRPPWCGGEPKKRHQQRVGPDPPLAEG